MVRIKSLSCAAIVAIPIAAMPVKAEVCSVTIGEENAAMATLSRKARERIAAHRAELKTGRSQFSGLPPEIQMALVRHRPPKLNLQASFYGGRAQAPAIEAALQSNREFRSALARMAQAASAAEVEAGRAAALAAIAANSKAVQGYASSVRATNIHDDRAGRDAGQSVRDNAVYNARMTDMVNHYANALLGRS